MIIKLENVSLMEKYEDTKITNDGEVIESKVFSLFQKGNKKLINLKVDDLLFNKFEEGSKLDCVLNASSWAFNNSHGISLKPIDINLVNKK
ncbi:MAG: hypothetical protein R3Y64_09380 [Peptostreptococcaceae bacterium]